MAGTATLTTTVAARTTKKYSIAWTSTAGGAVSDNAISIDPGGYVVQVKIVPGATTPTDLYDVTVLDADSVDILSTRGGDRLAASGEIFQFDPPLFIPARGTLDVNITNAGNAKTGRVDIFVEGVRL